MEHKIQPKWIRCHRQLPGSCRLWGPGLPPPSWSRPGRGSRTLPARVGSSFWCDVWRPLAALSAVWAVTGSSLSLSCCRLRCHQSRLQLHVVHSQLVTPLLIGCSFLVLNSHWSNHRRVFFSGWRKSGLSQGSKSHIPGTRSLILWFYLPCCLMPDAMTILFCSHEIWADHDGHNLHFSVCRCNSCHIRWPVTRDTWHIGYMTPELGYVTCDLATQYNDYFA